MWWIILLTLLIFVFISVMFWSDWSGVQRYEKMTNSLSKYTNIPPRYTENINSLNEIREKEGLDALPDMNNLKKTVFNKTEFDLLAKEFTDKFEWEINCTVGKPIEYRIVTKSEKRPIIDNPNISSSDFKTASVLTQEDIDLYDWIECTEFGAGEQLFVRGSAKPARPKPFKAANPMLFIGKKKEETKEEPKIYDRLLDI